MLTFFTPEEQRIEVTLGENGIPCLAHNDSVAPFNPLGVRTILLRPLPRRFRGGTVACIAKQLGVDRATVLRVAPLVPQLGSGLISVCRLDGNGRNVRIKLSLRGQDRIAEPYGFSGGETSRILVEFAAALAGYSARFSPTCLILDPANWTMDDAGLRHYSAFFADPRRQFQTILVHVDARKVPWEGWQRVELQQTSDVVRIESSQSTPAAVQ
jgi:hypothetical protein